MNDHEGDSLNLIRGPFIRAHAQQWRRGVGLLIAEGRTTAPGFEVNYATEVIFPSEPIDPGLGIPETLTLSLPAAQLLMDDLWQAGLRPSEGSGSAGALRAVERHLADMQKIAFSQLKIPNSDR